jgi:uncharacterized protein (TIGR02328 family)
MRLWHKDLIPVLPKQQLLGQWRECCCIAKNIAEKGTPNHILVNKIMDYPMTHLYTYGVIVAIEMAHRGYKCDSYRFTHYFTSPHETKVIANEDVFWGWHNDRYLKQCYYNLQEKYDCGEIPEEEWDKIERRIKI